MEQGRVYVSATRGLQKAGASLSGGMDASSPQKNDSRRGKWQWWWLGCRQGKRVHSKGHGPRRSGVDLHSNTLRARSAQRAPARQLKRAHCHQPPHFFFFFFLSALASTGAAGAASAAFCTPSAFAIMTKEMPPAMLLAPRMTEVMRRKAEEGTTGCSTMSSPLRAW